MAKCNTCGKIADRDSKICRNCGRPNPTKRRPGENARLFAFLLLCIVVFRWSEGYKAKTQATTSATLPTTTPLLADTTLPTVQPLQVDTLPVEPLPVQLNPDTVAAPLVGGKTKTVDSVALAAFVPPPRDQIELPADPTTFPLSNNASFDCSLANLSTVERTICGDEVLRSLDVTMAELYRRARVERRATVADQRAWLTVRAGCAKSASVVDCLKRLYDQRRAELQH